MRKLYELEANNSIKLSKVTEVSLMSKPIQRQKASTCLQLFHDPTVTALKVIKNRCFTYPSALAGIYLPNVHRRNTKTITLLWSIFSYLRIDFAPCSSVSIVGFEQINAH